MLEEQVKKLSLDMEKLQSAVGNILSASSVSNVKVFNEEQEKKEENEEDEEQEKKEENEEDEEQEKKEENEEDEEKEKSEANNKKVKNSVSKTDQEVEKLKKIIRSQNEEAVEAKKAYNEVSNFIHVSGFGMTAKEIYTKALNSFGVNVETGDTLTILKAKFSAAKDLVSRVDNSFDYKKGVDEEDGYSYMTIQV